jgi:GxxExxY protein
VDAAYHVHTSLGPGLLESVYEMVLAYELEKRALRVVRQQPVPIVYQGTRIEMGFRADLIVEDLVIVEIKSVEVVAPVHKKQLLTHLRLAGKRLGLLINFNVALINEGITRIANGMPG